MVVWPGATWSTADVARGWANGLEQHGVDVVRFRLDLRLEWLESHLTPDEASKRDAGLSVRRQAAEALAGALYEYRPDLILVVDGKDIPPEVWHGLRRRGERIVLVHTESPYEDDRICAMEWCADLHLVNDPVGVERLRKITPNVLYVPHAYDPTIHFPRTQQTEHDVVFVGSGFSGRARFLADAEWGDVRLTLAGQWRHRTIALPPELERYVADLPEPLPNEAAADLYRTSAVGFNLYRSDYLDNPRSGDGWAVNPREVEMAACGLFFLRQPRGEGDTLFSTLPTFGSPAELVDLATWWRDHPEARATAGLAAREAVADRTFDRHAGHLLRRVA